MTNLQQGASRSLSALQFRRLWLWGPIAAGGILAAVLAASVLVPLVVRVQRDAARVGELEAMKNEVGLLRAQLRKMDEDVQKEERLRSRLLALIAGSGDLTTFLAKLDQEARITGVQLDRFEPQESEPEPEPASGAQPSTPAPSAEAPPPPPGAPPQPPAELQGLRRQASLLAARGSFPALLAFLRRLEALNVLVVQSDLDLSLEEAARAQARGAAPADPVLLRLVVSMYGKPEGVQVSGAPAAPQPAAAE